MGPLGVVKVNRAKRTRAQFLKMLCDEVNDAQGPIEFYSRELDVVQTDRQHRPERVDALKREGHAVGQGGRQAHRDRREPQEADVQRQDADERAGRGRERDPASRRPAQSAEQRARRRDLRVDGRVVARARREHVRRHRRRAGRRFRRARPCTRAGTTSRRSARLLHGQGRVPGAAARSRAANRGDAPWKIANETEVNAVWTANHSTGRWADSYTHYASGQAGGARRGRSDRREGGGGGGERHRHDRSHASPTTSWSTRARTTGRR